VRIVLPILVPGLIVIALGCGGILSQSFDDAFMPTCVDEHATRIGDLSDPEAACACAKDKIEQEQSEPMDRLAYLADPQRMEQLLRDCDADANEDMEDPDAADAGVDEAAEPAEEPEADSADE